MRIRGSVVGGRQRTMTLRLSESEYILISDAAAKERIAMGTFVCNAALRRASSVVKRDEEKSK